MGALFTAIAATGAHAQAIKLADVAELSGGGATVGTNWKNGIDLAIEEINAKGGVLGRKLEVTHADSQSNPGVARAQVQKALDAEPYVLLGPGYSGSVKVTAPLRGRSRHRADHGRRSRGADAGRQQVPVPHLVRPAILDAEGREIHPRRHEGEDRSRWSGSTTISAAADATWSSKELERLGTKVVADLSTEAGQADFAADVGKIKAANPDVVFVYLNEEESARILKEIKRQGVTAPLMGETTLIGQKVIELAGDAANGARGHVGLTTDAPVDLIKAFREKFSKKYNYVPDHNGLKGYPAIYMVKATTEKMGKVDPEERSPTRCTASTIKAADEPGILMDPHRQRHRRPRSPRASSSKSSRASRW